jgi:hypothetical protein
MPFVLISQGNDEIRLIKINRHPERVSASISPQAMSSFFETWILKQVQDDVV